MQKEWSICTWKVYSCMSRDRCHGIRCADWLLYVGGRKSLVFLRGEIESSYFLASQKYWALIIRTSCACGNMVPDPLTQEVLLSSSSLAPARLAKRIWVCFLVRPRGGTGRHYAQLTQPDPSLPGQARPKSHSWYVPGAHRQFVRIRLRRLLQPITKSLHTYRPIGNLPSHRHAVCIWCGYEKKRTITGSARNTTR